VSDRAREIYVAGTGSFALEITEYAEAAGLRVVGLIELVDSARVGSKIHGFEVLGVDHGSSSRGSVVIGFSGDRLAHWSALAEQGWAAGSLIHPRAHVSPSAVVGEGSIIGPGAIVGAASQVGGHVLLGRGVLIGHHVRVDAGVTLNPGANIAGNAAIGQGATIGMGALISNGITVGAGATVASGAVVVKPVHPHTRVQGVPARVYSPR
jgi:sugar O-acyltransferase (sialic acid O-acetyltransferase NeuD family)